ncbi:FecR domain-containing protein [Echinicola marina]|uniref:FecR family protein n=1 Tax=Echinicola marina TaxID=2859768 RepID=UPI001CF62158|nr:FecR domain-containing protein [Echinicola marina]UCS91704.1 FecR domain-containing protein [Echinicola marina]
MNRSELKELLSRYSEGKASEAERERLIQWYKNANEQEADEFLDHLAGFIDDMDQSELSLLERRLLSKEVPQALDNSKTKDIKVLPLVKIAAAMIIFLMSTFLLFQYIQVDDEKILEYSTKVGEIREIVLPDQSLVVLNSVSVLRIPEEFSADSREVSLDGEAFFDVQRDEARPFTVLTENGVKVSVLGTSFNIKDYSDAGQVEVAVASGKVAVGKGNQLFGRIIKGQQITYDKESNEFFQSNTAHVDSWIDGKIMFSEHSLKEVANILNRTFVKKLVIGEGVNQSLLIKGSFEKGQGIEGIVDILCILHDLEYDDQEDQIVIMDNNR